MKTAQSDAGSYTGATSHESAENVSGAATERPSGMSADGEGATFDLIAHLTEELGWVRRTSRIEIGEPFAQVDRAGRIIYGLADQPWKPENTRVYTPPPPPPTPSPIDLIPVGRSNAKVLEVNGVVGTYFRSEDWIRLDAPEGSPRVAIHGLGVANVTPIRTLADDDVAVKRDVLKSILEAPESGLTNRDHDELVAALAKAGDPS